MAKTKKLKLYITHKLQKPKNKNYFQQFTSYFLTFLKHSFIQTWYINWQAQKNLPETNTFLNQYQFDSPP